MFEYLNTGAFFVTLIVSIITIIIAKVQDDKGIKLILFPLIIIMFAIVFYEARSDFNTANENMQLFRTGESLKCFSGGGAYSSAESYRVSKADGWELDKKYFVKESLMIQVHKCEKW